MSEYCDTCEEVLDWISDEMDDRDNCVKCQIKAAKLEVLNKVLSKGASENHKFLREVILAEIKELESVPTAFQLGFRVGKAYCSNYDMRCTYHIVSETHYTAVFVDGSQPPSIDVISMLGSRENYNVIEW